MSNPTEITLTETQYLMLLRQAHVGAVAAAALHEFSNFATPVLMRAQDAVNRDDPAAYKQSTESALRNIPKAITVAEKLVLLAKSNERSLELVSVDDLIASAFVAMGRPLEKERIEVRRNIAANLSVRVDRALFEQLLVHLLMEIKSAIAGRAARLAIKVEREGQSVVLEFDCFGERCTREYVESNWAAWLDTNRTIPPLGSVEREFALRAIRLIASAHQIEMAVSPHEPIGGLIRLRLPLPT